MASFELNVRAYSPWMDAFTTDEWVAYGYTLDLGYYYCFGYVISSFACSLMFNTNITTSRPGSEYQIATGQVYANATRVLMEAGPEAGSMFWSLSVIYPFYSFFFFLFF